MTTRLEDFAFMRINEIACIFDKLSRQRIHQIMQSYIDMKDIDTIWKLKEAKRVLKQARLNYKREQRKILKNEKNLVDNPFDIDQNRTTETN
jgi:hypothetical protein